MVPRQRIGAEDITGSREAQSRQIGPPRLPLGHGDAYEKIAPGLAQYLHDAIKANAARSG